MSFRDCVQTFWLFAYRSISHSTFILLYIGTENQADTWKVGFHKSLCELASSWIHPMRHIHKVMYGKKIVLFIFIYYYFLLPFYFQKARSWGATLNCSIIGSCFVLCFHISNILLEIIISCAPQISWKGKLSSLSWIP